jgi:hypothetical protein
MSESLKEIRSYLAALTQGKIEDARRIESLLAACWSELPGSGEGGMLPYKLLGRTENMEWNPPVLTFEVERHGARVQSSVYAELQMWTVDMDSGLAELSPYSSKRLVGKRQASVNVNVLAEEIAALVIAAKKDDDRLKWYGSSKVKVLIGEIFPAGSAVRETLAGRRRRLGKVIADRLGPEGWRKTGVHTFEKP